MKTKAFVVLLCIFCTLLSVNALAYSYPSNKVSLYNAYIKDNTVVLNGRLTEYDDNQQLVFMAQEVFDEGNKTLYIDQTDANCDPNGNFSITFDLSFLSLDSKGVYKARLGGTGISEPCEMLIVFSGDDTKVLLGDVNLDGIISSQDAAITLQYVLLNFGLIPEQKKAMRVMEQDLITAENAAHILSKTLDSMYKFPVER